MWKSNGHNALLERHPETHVNVLIVGAGVGGLMTALECWRKGHNIVGILERNKGPDCDLIVVQPSAMSTMRHCPDMCRDLEEDRVDIPEYYWKHNGELIFGPAEAGFNYPELLADREGLPYLGAVQTRKKFYLILLRQVAKLGFEYVKRVERYFEDEATGLGGGMVVEDGSVRVAHIVVAADASKSRLELLIASQYTSAQSSGPGIHMEVYISPDFVALGATPRRGFLAAGSSEARESWDTNIDPRGSPQGTWTSIGGRVVQIGDAAHFNVPTSASCGTLALEDAITLASCLQLSYCNQKVASVNSQGLNSISKKKDAIKKDPKKVRLRFPKWFFRPDPEAYAYEKYG
ncbi:hypothetical protein BGW36DRAFT_394719 [Talaromyces proteolyticus]|uniref:FAD-binding domain-containing protein n=1 Tax=Talaromyces proteolyticus TaxID=1131652 RepID=A0AAD4KWV4_9EURO|nr:uncharacterized protein BGW36DRAFT_394719 [Talaromyces proteolyticus]KAH8701949.1 hypothetical protein BGW36DRAFT_394719 [Talaromyces proteolyticus]